MDMLPKIKRLLVSVLFLATVPIYADVSDPVEAFKNSAHLASGTVLYRWEADVDGSGRNDVFLDLDEDFHRREKHFDNIPGWCVYLQNANKSGYVPSRGTVIPSLGAGVGPAVPQINIDKMYIGPISQLGRSGIVTLQIDNPQRAPSVAYIRAYTVEGDHLKETTLAQYDPTKGSNPIYDQYLSKEQRTSVKLDKITLP